MAQVAQQAVADVRCALLGPRSAQLSATRSVGALQPGAQAPAWQARADPSGRAAHPACQARLARAAADPE